MARVEHTPGPWHTERNRSDGPLHVKNKDLRYVMEGNKNIHATIRNDADARLIAAAPDLLSAAQNALNYMRLHKYADQSWADDLEAAIVKATGETP